MADTEDRPEVEQCALAMLAAIRGTRRASGPLEKAEHLLASSWLAARDERIRADEREKLAGVLPDHVWRGGYYCQCGHELNSATGWFAHLVDSARLTGEVEAR